MYTVTFSNEELEEMKANDAVVIVSCDDVLTAISKTIKPWKRNLSVMKLWIKF